MKIGIIGGSGLDNPNLIENYQEKNVETPYGAPSSPLATGKIEGVEVCILSRHGKKHTIMPSNVPFRANIWALKQQNCTHILVSTACGSLREEIKPGHLVLPNQFIDKTTKRISTFYDKEQVCHVSMEEPFCPKLRDLLEETIKGLNLPYYKDKTVITIEGPRFSTKAESRLWRQFGADIVNMSIIPEAILARESGICYQPLAMSTDYDCFMETKENVTWEQITKIMKQNAENVKKIFIKTIPKIKDWECECKEAIKKALV